MSSSPRLALPYLLPAQAQKHVTHNEAIERLDVLVQLVVAGFDAVTPPADPDPAEAHLLAAAPEGAWAGQGGALAVWMSGGWVFVAPQPGWIAATPEGEARLLGPTGWQPLGPGVDGGFDDLDGIGIGTAFTTLDRLTSQASGTLLTHDGSDHRLKINRATATDTASLLFQSGFSGRAEIGLAGSDDLAIKVSADGSAWTTALSVSPQGAVSGAAVQQGPADTTPGRLMRADYGYGPGNALGTVALSAGVPTGALIETGSTGSAAWTRWADGTQVCTYSLSCDLSAAAGYIDVAFPTAFSGTPAGGWSANRTGSGTNVTALQKMWVATDQTGWSVWNPGGGSGSVTLRLTATGRWA